jgi:hypothetical protein
MPINAQKYIRKPLYVDAVRVTSANFDELATWCQGEVLRDEDGSGKKYIKVRVHNPINPRQMKAFVGDWLLYTERGYKVYTNKAFHLAFDKVTVGESQNGSSNGDSVEVPKYPEPELVPATPEGIAEAVRENEAAYPRFP